jgi:hypothetical protein
MAMTGTAPVGTDGTVDGLADGTVDMEVEEDLADMEVEEDLAAEAGEDLAVEAAMVAAETFL